MPQVDLETLVSACAGVSCDRKIACETLATTVAAATVADDSNHHQPPESETDSTEIPADFPPESFWLSKDAELDWFDRNAFIERKDSTKVSPNSTNLNPNINPHPNPSNSQRFSNLKSKASILGLPKAQKFVDTKNRRHCKPGNTRLFPKRSGSSGKSDSSLFEPSSPKVSCMGRVRSKRDRNRRSKNRQQQRSNSKRRTELDCKSEKKPERKQKTGFFWSIFAIFGKKPGSKHAWTLKIENDASCRETSRPQIKKSASVRTYDIRDRLPASDRDVPPRRSVGSAVFDDVGGVEPAAVEPVCLGGMKRFASGRRSESFGVDVA